MQIRYIKPDGNKAATCEMVYECPALTGSEKQIKWAEDLRRTAEREFVEGVQKHTGKAFSILIASDFDSADGKAEIDETHAAYDALLATGEKGETVASSAAKVFGQTDAKWWIETGRMYTGWGLVGAIATGKLTL